MTAICTYLAAALGNLRVAVLTAATLVVMGLQGLWVDSMETLAMTAAAVLVSLLIGIPLGVLAGFNDTVDRLITPVLDFMQTMPPFVYLAPLALFFGIGPAASVIVTLIFAAPPVIRLTAHGIRGVAPATVEASRALGATRWQTLTGVLIPMARRTIVLGINQTIMAALAMVTIAALIDGPGLGKIVVKALAALDVGTAFNAGMALVIMAIMLDRLTTAMAMRSEGVGRGPQRKTGWAAQTRQRRRPLLIAGAVVVLVLAWLSRTYVWAATFPSVKGGPLDLGRYVRQAGDSTTAWVQSTFPWLSEGLMTFVTTKVIDPLQALLETSPWWLTAGGILALAWIAGRLVGVITAALCLALVIWTGLWQDTMVTLASTLVATVIVMLIGAVLGVWMGRSGRADALIRPVLDAAQVMPPFVYMVPVLALFAPGRFSAAIAAVVYAAPVAVKIIADGVRNVSRTTVEAAVASGSTSGQVIRKVQLPMAMPALVVAANQGLIFVLSMVVMGAMVGGGALGNDVLGGFTQREMFGKGLAAGLSIVLLGIMLDRITQAASRRTGRPARRPC